LRSFCRIEGNPALSSVVRWIESSPEFSEKYKLAKQALFNQAGKKWKVEDRKQGTLRVLSKDDFSQDRIIYMIALKGTDLYKIGITKNIKKRMQTIQGCSPFDIELINTISGSKATEYAFQSILEPFWVRGEWFKCPEDFAIGISIIREVMKSGKTNSNDS
jgi:hypothetical protein